MVEMIEQFATIINNINNKRMTYIGYVDFGRKEHLYIVFKKDKLNDIIFDYNYFWLLEIFNKIGKHQNN